MDGKAEIIIDELFKFAVEKMDGSFIYPYVSFLVKNETIISRGFNRERETLDITRQSDVDTIRNAQESLDTGNLSGYSLYSFFEPTILGFDVALWSGIKDFHWCINSSSLPKHYNKLKYTPLSYLKDHPGEITIEAGIREEETIKLAFEAKKRNLYPDNLI